MNKNILMDKLFKLVTPIVEDLNYELYHLEYVMEGQEYYLRIYIEKENERISLEDCEKVSRAVSDMLDVEDPIADQYYLEVSSPGIDRIIHTDKHLHRYIGSNILVKLSGLLNGKKKFEGELLSFNSEELIVKCQDESISIPREKASSINLRCEL